MAPTTRPIVFLSDFGLSNEWVGISHAVLTRIAPQSPIVDLSHLVPPLDVLSGALLLADSMPYISGDAVVLAVVDPNVGKDRDIAIEVTGGRHLVGPDNGLFAPTWEALGGVQKVVEITSDEIIVQPVAPMFHARDILCPAAAHLAAGVSIDQLGAELDPSSLAGLDVPEPEIQAGKIRCEVVEFNRFGNVKLNVREAHLIAAGIQDNADLAVEAVSGSTRAKRGETYADFTAGEYGVIFDPRGWLMVVRGNPASALEGLGLATGDPVWISGPASRSELVTP
jgi:S-adenosyl-L-methionine hydrolase (adenosine-forming)